MEALLPSEISRLILGYLEEQCCTAAYQTFLETCPHLKECAEAAAQGLRFSTRAAGRSLRDILNEYCLIYTIVQERIQKLPDSSASQLKAYGVSLADQVKQLIDGKQTGQRFHVNITVPTQPKSSKPRHGAPVGAHTPSSSHHMVTPTSSRLRRLSHPIQEQRLTLRSQDPTEDVTASVTVQRVETTQLENLPGSSTPSSVAQPIRRVSFSGCRNESGGPENAANDQEEEEENSSLLDPKTGELISPSAVHSSDLSGRSAAPETILGSKAESQPVETNSSSRLSVRQGEEPGECSKVSLLDQSSSGNRSVQNESGSGRTSLDKLLINILSTQATIESDAFHDKNNGSVSCPSVTVTRTGDSGVVLPVESSCARERSAGECAFVNPSVLPDDARIESCLLASPHPKQVQKSALESEAATPRRSAAKRKTKPTPLKMMTPLKLKTVTDSSDSSEVKIDPKLIYEPLLGNRELHERIAENINQYICPSGNEDGTEARGMNTSEAAADALASTSVEGKGQPSKDTSTQEELEKVIKSVVDKTESDPLFESLLQDILGPDCDEDSMVDSFVEESSTLDPRSNGEVAPGDGRKDPISLLEDQNEAAIKSILEAQPMKDTPNPKQGKTAPKCKGKRVARKSKAKVFSGIPSGACLPIFAGFESSGKNSGPEAGGVRAATSNENVQANGQDVNKLIILPFQDIVMPPIACPTIIFNGVPQCLVPASQSKPRPIPIAPKDPVSIIPGNPPYILRKVNSEDVKHINLSSVSCEGLIIDTQTSFSTTINETSVNVGVVQEAYSDQVVSAVHNVDLTGHIDVLETVTCSNSGATVDFHVPSISLGPENGAGKSLAAEIRSGLVEKGSTPDVLMARPTRSATEGQQKTLEDQGDTPTMAAGKRRVSMSTPRRKSRGHVRALDFGSTPPKQGPSVGGDSTMLATSTPYEAPSKGSLLSLNAARKELSKCLGTPGTMTLPDLSTTCIATRSPPPQLSRAWNKVGVDLIFGGDTSPTAEHSSLQGQGALEASKAHQEGSRDGRGGSPKGKPKGNTWDAALRAQLGETPVVPTLTRGQKRALLRLEKQKKRLEAQEAAEEAKRKKVEESSAKKSRAKPRSKSSDSKCRASAKGKGGQRKSLEEPEVVSKQSSGMEESPSEEKGGEEASAGNEEEGDQVVVGEKRKRSSLGEAPVKKKVATETRPALELDTASSVPMETVTSPEKTWVVQQSPGSWANKRSLHGQNLDAEGSKFLPISSAARRCLDLHETPRKPEPLGANEKGMRSSDLGSKNSGAGDRTTLTVVDTPLFPPTPGICIIGTPPSQDSREAVEAFPTYFKPREKDGSAGKEKNGEAISSEYVGASKNPQVGDNVGRRVEESANDAESAEKSGVGASDSASGADVNPVEGSGTVEDSDTVVKKNEKPRKPPIKKAPAAQGKAVERSKKGKSKAEDESGEDEGEEVLPTRVLRPRKKTSYYQEEVLQSEEPKKDESCEREHKGGTSKKRSAAKKKRKPPSPEADPCGVVPGEEGGVVYAPLTPEVIGTHSQEAEVLAKQIKLKLSPLAPKACDSEEEEDDGDSVSSLGGKKEEGSSAGRGPEDGALCGEPSSSDSEPEVPAAGARPSSADRGSVEGNNEGKESGEKGSGGEPKESADGSKSTGDHTKKDEVVVEPQGSTSKGGNADESGEKKLIVVQWKKGSDKVAMSGAGSGKTEQSRRAGERGGGESTESLLSLEKKKRRDNLEKILFGRDSNDTEESTEAGELPSTLLPLSDHSLSSELELKKQRTLDKLRRGKSGQISGVLERIGPSQLQHPARPPSRVSSSPATTQCMAATPNKAESAGTQKSPRKSTPAKEGSQVVSIFYGDEDDCPELRLSEGEEIEFGSPEKILISPGKYDLLETLEGRLAVLHGDIASPVFKKTARMSCTPAASSRSAEMSPRKEPVKVVCSESNVVGRVPDVSSTEIRKGSQPTQGSDPLPSTSKAAELRYKAEEKRYLSLLQSSTPSGVTVRKKSSERQRRSLRLSQPEAGNEDVLMNEEDDMVGEESVLDNENRVLQDKNSEKIAEGKNNCQALSLKKARESGESQASVGLNVSAGAKTIEEDVSKDNERSHGTPQPQAGVGAKPCDKSSTEKNSVEPQPSVCHADSGEVLAKHNKRPQQKSSELAAEVERSKDKPSRLRKKSGHAQGSCSKDAKSLMLDLTEDELTRDGFANDTSREKVSDEPPHVSVDLSFQNIPEFGKNVLQSGRWEKQENVDPSKVMKGDVCPTRKNNDCDAPPSKPSQKKSGANKRRSSPSRVKTQGSRKAQHQLNSKKVKKKLSEDGKRKVNIVPKETSQKSSKNTQESHPNKCGGGDPASLKAPSGKPSVQKSAVAGDEKSESAPVLVDSNVLSQLTPEGLDSHNNVSNVVTSPDKSLHSDAAEVPLTGGALSENADDAHTPESGGIQAPAEEAANNSSLAGVTNMSFSSNEAYITIVYDEDSPPTPSTSILMSQLGPPLPPSAPELEGLTVELEGEVVTITKSDYIELFSYTPMEAPPQVSRGLRGKVSSAIVSKKPKGDVDGQKVGVKKKEDLGLKLDSEGVLSSGKRKNIAVSEKGKGEVKSKAQIESHEKDKNAVSNEQMALIQRVVEACNASNENSIDDDSLMTYAAVGSVCLEENLNKEDGGSKRFLPLKKRRTTTDDTPVKSQTEGDVVNSNSGIFFPLNGMEIEDFLSKVHGDGS